MLPPILFLVDENLPVDVVEVLREAGYDCTYVRESNYRGATDAVLSQLAGLEGRIVITRDLGFIAQSPTRPAGLILLRVPPSFGRREIRSVVEDLVAHFDFRRALGYIVSARPGLAPRLRPMGELSDSDGESRGTR